MNRRDFLSAATRGAAAAAAVATPALAATGAFGGEVYDRLAAQLAATRDALGRRLDTLVDELDGMSTRVQRLELQHQLLLYLLLVSLLLDGGLTWLVLHAPAAPLV